MSVNNSSCVCAVLRGCWCWQGAGAATADTGVRSVLNVCGKQKRRNDGSWYEMACELRKEHISNSSSLASPAEEERREKPSQTHL